MKYCRMVLLACPLLLALSVSGLSADRAAVQNEVWRTYLSPSEQAALARINAPEEQGSEPVVPETPADPVEHSRMLRGMFEGLVKEIAPPVQSVPAEASAKDGVKGLWLRPDGATDDRVLLYFHGGGYIVGSPDTAAAIAGFLAREAGILCFSLDYPLAPEAPFPAATDSALAAYRMLLDSGFAAGGIVLAGDSAGGGLALAALQEIRDAGLPMPAGAYLISPWVDLTMSLESHVGKSAVDTMITTDSLEMMAAYYTQGQDRRNSLISPVFADLRGLPPLLVQAGSHETLLDDSLAVVRNAAMADVPVQLSVWPGYGHVFQMVHGTLEGGRKALREGARFIDAAMDKSLLRDTGAVR